jgi:hypothetical protein
LRPGTGTWRAEKCKAKAWRKMALSENLVPQHPFTTMFPFKKIRFWDNQPFSGTTISSKFNQPWGNQKTWALAASLDGGYYER